MAQIQAERWIELTPEAATIIETGVALSITDMEDTLAELRKECGPWIVDDDEYIGLGSWMETAKKTLEAIRATRAIALLVP